jgi:hypothetical protein
LLRRQLVPTTAWSGTRPDNPRSPSWSRRCAAPSSRRRLACCPCRAHAARPLVVARLERRPGKGVGSLELLRCQRYLDGSRAAAQSHRPARRPPAGQDDSQRRPRTSVSVAPASWALHGPRRRRAASSSFRPRPRPFRIGSTAPPARRSSSGSRVVGCRSVQYAFASTGPLVDFTPRSCRRRAWEWRRALSPASAGAIAAWSPETSTGGGRARGRPRRAIYELRAASRATPRPE